MNNLINHLNFGTFYYHDKCYPPAVLHANIDAIAEYLTQNSISNSPFVYLFAENHIKTVYALFGIIKANKICVIVDPAIKKFDLDEMIKDSAPGSLIKIDGDTDVLNFEKEIECKHYQLNEDRISGLENVCIMLYTAGGDGFLKGAMLTHENIISNAFAGIETVGVKKGSLSCTFASLCHLFAIQTGVIFPSFVGGNSFIVNASGFGDMRKNGLFLEQNLPDHIYGVPFAYYLLDKIPNLQKILSQAKCVVSGGVKLSARLYNIYKTKYNVKITEGYGLTEASPTCSWDVQDNDDKPGTVGTAFPCCQIAVFDEGNKMLLPNEVGEICVKGTNIMKGYYNNDAETKRVLVDGWFHTGDFGRIDNEGCVFLTGLKKRMLNSCGNKVWPALVERHMLRHKNILSVEVFGEHDDLLGDVVNAKVKLRNNTSDAQKELRAWCLDNITKFNVPRRFEFI